MLIRINCTNKHNYNPPNNKCLVCGLKCDKVRSCTFFCLSKVSHIVHIYQCAHLCTNHIYIYTAWTCFFSNLNFLHVHNGDSTFVNFVNVATLQCLNELLVCAFASCGFWICAHHSGESPLCTCDASLKEDCRHSCFRVHKYARICRNMHKYERICTNMQKYAKICPNYPNVP